MGLPPPNTTRQSAGWLSTGWSAFLSLFRLRNAKASRILFYTLIIVLWVLYFLNPAEPSSSNQEKGKWMETISRPARQAGEVIVEFVKNKAPKSSSTATPETIASPYAGVFEIMGGTAYTQNELTTAPTPATATVTETVTFTPTPSPAPRRRPGVAPPGGRPLPLPDPPPRQSAVRQRFLTVATMVKNQRRWLREWIEFHHMMGVEHFIIYDNESTDLSIEVVQAYIDEGLVEWIPWPPKEIPPPPYEARTKMEDWQDSWFRDSLETCLENTWTIHKQGPCQLAAFLDAIRKTNHGVSRWLGIWDVDEFIFPRPSGGFQTMTDLLKERYDNYTQLSIIGMVFGTNGHIHPATRRPGSELHPLLTEEYTSRAPLQQGSEYPFEKLHADGWEVDGKGKLGHIKFAGADMYARKSLADPDLTSHSWIHTFDAPGNVGPEWEQLWIDVDDPLWKFNHYAFLSQEESRRKSMTNKNPFMGFDDEIDEFFSREKDTEVQYYLPALKERMLRTIREHPPVHPDDWQPPKNESTT